MNDQLMHLLENLGGKRVLVVGDLYLDCYIFGTPSRISREAPIMILEEDRREERLGGGAAPALALAQLGFDVTVAGVVGDDGEGRLVRELLGQRGINPSGVIADRLRPTTTKTRVVAEGFLLFPQQIVRVDRQERTTVANEIEQSLAAIIGKGPVDAIVVSDYRSGVVTEQVVEAVRAVKSSGCTLAAVDSQGELSKFTGFDLVKCNKGEVEQVLGRPIGDLDGRQTSLCELRERLLVANLVVTRGGEGASLASAHGYHEVPAFNRSEIFDVTGAGDMVVAVMTAALLAGGSPLEATMLGQAAAGVVVRKWGNAQATRAEIAAELRR